MDFITDIKGPLLERFSPEQVNDIVDIITLALVRYDVEPKSTALVEYKADDFELVQKFFVAKATEGLTQNTLRYYKTVLQKALKTFNKHIKDITTNDVRAYIVSMKFRGNTERTQNNERRVLSSFFKFLLAEGEITTNPMLRINKIKEPKKLKKPLSESLERIFNYKYPYEYINGFDELLRRKERVTTFYDELAEYLSQICL